MMNGNLCFKTKLVETTEIQPKSIMMQASKSLIICLFCLTVGTEADGENVTNNNNLRLSKDANVSDKSKLRKNAFRRPRFFDESQWSPVSIPFCIG